MRERGGGALKGQRIIRFSVEKRMKSISYGQMFFVQKGIISEVRRVEFVSDRMSYVILRGCWCNIIVVRNVHATCEDKSDDVKDSFYEELGRVFDQFPSYDMKVLLGDFNAKVGREDIFKRQLGMRVHTKLVMIMELGQYILQRLRT
jgi:hypothetical protein